MKKMEIETLEQYIQKHRPNILDEYKRATTPFYYEPGVIYHPITNGFGCGPQGSNEHFVIKDGTYLKGGEIFLSLQSLDKADHRCSVLLSEAHLKIKRVDESVAPIGTPIPNDKEIKYMEIDGKNYTITQLTWRHHSDKTLGGKIWVRCDQYPTTKVYGQERAAYYELYSNFGSTWNLKHVKSYDEVAREQYDIKFNVSMREFKRIVFGDPNIKIKCQLFGDK